MMDLRIKLRDGFSRWLGGVGRALRMKSAEATDEAGAIARPTPRDEAEEALWQAMGWTEPEGEDVAALARRKVKGVF
jgi:hypothetical protein